MKDSGTAQGSILISVSGPTPIVRTATMPPAVPEGHLNLLSVPAYVLGLLWVVALVVWRAQALAGSKVGTEFLRFARPTVSAAAVAFGSVWPDLPGLTAVSQIALLVALCSSLALAIVARITRGRAYVVLLALALLAGVSLLVAAVSVLTSGLPFSETAAGLLLQVALLVALANGAWRLQRQLVLADTDDFDVNAPPAIRGVDRVASGVFFIYLASIIGPVWIGRKLLGSEMNAVAVMAPDSVAAKLFNSASPWFYAFGASLGAVLYAIVLLVPPFKRRARLVALGCILGVLAVGPGLSTIGDEARAASAAVVGQVRATLPTGAQLGWVCATWSSPDQPGVESVFQGDGCRQLVTYQGQVKMSELTLQHDFYNDTAVPSARDNTIASGTGFLYGVYGNTFIALAESPSAPGGHVVYAYDMTSATEAWSFSCPAGSGVDGFRARFSGSTDGDQPASNRETLELYGLMEYVAVDCGPGAEYILRTDGSVVGQ